MNIDNQFKELIKYKKVDLVQMVVLQRISIETLNEIIDKLKRCGNCEHFLCGTCEVYGNADVLGEREPCEKWKVNYGEIILQCSNCRKYNNVKEMTFKKSKWFCNNCL